MNRTVMVTGGSGLVGSYVMRQLVENRDNVINFDMREPGPEAHGSRFGCSRFSPCVRVIPLSHPIGRSGARGRSSLRMAF